MTNEIGTFAPVEPLKIAISTLANNASKHKSTMGRPPVPMLEYVSNSLRRIAELNILSQDHTKSAAQRRKYRA